MISRTHLTALLGLAAIFWGAVMVLSGLHVSMAFAKPFSIVLGLVSIALGLFNRWIWRLPWLHSWFVTTPNLQGTWKGEVLPSGIDLETGQPIPAIQAYLVIRQTFSSISIRLITQESASELLAGSIAQSSDGLHTIFGTYQNTPRLQKRDESPIHYGGLFLHVQGEPPTTLQGQYWTDRNTRGELRFGRHGKKFAQTFEEAAALTT